MLCADDQFVNLFYKQIFVKLHGLSIKYAEQGLLSVKSGVCQWKWIQGQATCKVYHIKNFEEV